MLTTEICVDSIIDYFIKKNINKGNELRTDFYDIINKKNWKRLSKSGTNNNILRKFENKKTHTKINVLSSETEIKNIIEVDSDKKIITKFDSYNKSKKKIYFGNFNGINGEYYFYTSNSKTHVTDTQYWKNGEFIQNISSNFQVNVNISENRHRLILSGGNDISDIKEFCSLLESEGMIYSDFGNKTDIDKIVYSNKTVDIKNNKIMDDGISNDWYFNINMDDDTITINVSKSRNALEKSIEEGINVVDDYDNHRGYIDNINDVFADPWYRLIKLFHDEDLEDVGEESSGNYGTWEFTEIDEDKIHKMLKKMKKSLIKDGFIEI
ncbi:hypothetical protein M0Q50_01320 [bacterium]|jgi:hypothetical protein|nr:hypothetical protein [bacterium]